jgi:MinD superfamily P-loop ATPase
MKSSSIKIAVASGKGGTGKTTVATSLALSQAGRQHCLVDCDVEAPNAHLFFDLTEFDREIVTKPIPVVDFDRCIYCGKCAEVCEFHAITVLNKPILSKQNVVIFPNLCHSCGACTYICPERAITETPNPIGKIHIFDTPEDVTIFTGEMQVGTAMAVPIIQAVQNKAEEYSSEVDIMIYDAPPGNSCSVVETIKQVDYVILVTEPTPFGLHDLKLTVALVQQLNKSTGVIINRDGIGNDDVENFLAENNIPVLMRIPFDPEIASGLSQGIPLPKQSAKWVQAFQDLAETILREVIA